MVFYTRETINLIKSNKEEVEVSQRSNSQNSFTCFRVTREKGSNPVTPQGVLCGRTGVHSLTLFNTPRPPDKRGPDQITSRSCPQISSCISFTSFSVGTVKFLVDEKIRPPLVLLGHLYPQKHPYLSGNFSLRQVSFVPKRTIIFSNPFLS